MLDQDFDTNQTTATETTATAVAQPAPTAVQPAAAFGASPFAAVLNKFEGILGAKFLPMEATTSTSPETDGITVRTAKPQSAGTWITVKPQSISSYLKLDLGTQPDSDEEKKLAACCWDGETVMFDNNTYSKNEFLDLVKERGFSKASWKERAVLYATYLDSEKALELTEDESLLSVYLSPSAWKAWKGFVAKTMITPSAATDVRITRELAKTTTGKSYPTASFGRVNFTGKEAD